MTVVGLDIGGTKVETRVFDAAWSEIARDRVATPPDYADLVATIADQISRAEAGHGALAAVGVGTAGLIHPVTGLALTANLAASGRPFATDIAAAAGRPVTLVNDCRAFALSEAVFGAGRGHRTVMSLILGTGVGGGIAIDGRLLPGPTATGGEYGHSPASARLVQAHDLPVYECGCGRRGCVETYVAGPGLERLALHLTGQTATAPDIGAAQSGPLAAVRDIWCALTAELILSMTLMVDPDVIVLGGGLSGIPDVVRDLHSAARAAQMPGFDIPPIVLAEGGDASGARGAAYAAALDVPDA